MHCVCGMQERSSHVSTCTTKDELDGVEEWGRKNIYMHLPTLPRLSGMEGRGDCGEQIYLLLLTCFTRPKEIIWITVD